MIEVTIKCETPEEARIYLNATDYIGLLQDMYAALRSARKHGNDADVVRVVESFYADISKACDHAEGAY